MINIEELENTVKQMGEMDEVTITKEQLLELTKIAKLYSKIEEERADKSEQEYFDRINRQIDDPFGEDARSPFCGDEASTKEFWAEMYANDPEGYEMGAYDYDEY